MNGHADDVAAKAAAAGELLLRVARKHAPAVLAASFGAEDMVLVDLLASTRAPIAIFTLDTGRLPDETHALMARVVEHYGVRVTVYAPEARAVESYVETHGFNGFYDSKRAREACCAARKSAPLARALAGQGAWVTGLRREQSITRSTIEVSEFDAAHGLHKFNPLAEWSRSEVWHYLREHDVPYNPLHDRGYASIGCAPCTRAIGPDDDERAGRWWWEDPERRECGLHRRPGAAIPIVALPA